MLNKELLVKISQENSYPIFIDCEPISSIEDKIRNYTSANILLLVISEKVNKLYGNNLNFKNSIKYILKDGENQKNFKNYQKILNFAFKNKLERKDAIVAIGGGVVGDIAGFVAATYLRGIDFIQIPTTLLACVDSSVGGKVAINSDYGKNLVGAFYQPKAVFCNLNFLKTLDDRQFKTGLGEIVKYAFIEKSCGAGYSEGESFFDFLLNNSDMVLSRDDEFLSKIIEISLKLKIAVVEKDEKEQGLRRILNFGHTYAHAVEKITNYKKYTHGEAVSIGIVYALNLAVKRNLIKLDFKNSGIDLLKKYNLIYDVPHFSSKKMLELMFLDKKVKNGKINFILPSDKYIVDCFELNSDEILL